MSSFNLLLYLDQRNKLFTSFISTTDNSSPTLIGKEDGERKMGEVDKGNLFVWGWGAYVLFMVGPYIEEFKSLNLL